LTDTVDKRLAIMVVHAHPDDEVFGGGATLARYADEGIHAILVTSTNGECGEVLDPDLDPEKDKERLGEIRVAELRRAADALGVETLELLGYRDSGMWEWPSNGHPESFNQADLNEAVGRMVRLIRQHRPDVVVTYNEDGGYAHPDHLMTHLVTTAAFQAAADPTRYPDAGEPWAASKLYALAWSRGDMHRLWWALKERGIKWPGRGEADEDRPPDWGAPDEMLTARIDVSGYRDRIKQARAAHRSQLKPDGFWNSLPEDIASQRFRYENFIRLRSRVKAPEREDDLFAGVPGRTPVEAEATAD
jgi:mycothiol S-conjugate amidase